HGRNHDLIQMKNQASSMTTGIEKQWIVLIKQFQSKPLQITIISITAAYLMQLSTQPKLKPAVVWNQARLLLECDIFFIKIILN
ncbi:hypothetical protein, partial [Xenorhabdus bovienii]|uniref:hypothetical protein n=1 Tax=Xenorhabdus bovienii TaxID=40576 RepID=UPI001E3D222B